MRLPPETPLRGLLRCLDVGFFVPTFEEEGLREIQDLRNLGREEAAEFMTALSMPHQADERLLAWAFGQGEQGEGEGVSDDGDGEAEEEEAPATEQQAAAERKVVNCGRAFDPAWLRTISPLYARKMGCENMGPLLYSLARFVKPRSCLEIGAGYTSAFLLQALEDNAREAEAWLEWQQETSMEGWLVEESLPSQSSGGTLHCVDNLAHEGTTANRLLEVATSLGLESRLSLHLDDARAFLDEYNGECIFDFVWLDGFLDFAFARGGGSGSSVGSGLDDFMADMWPRVAPGGFVLLHSTLTNSMTRAWVEGLRNGADSKWGPPGAMLSLLEPCKRFQNAVTILQRRPEGFAEPIYSKLP